MDYIYIKDPQEIERRSMELIAPYLAGPQLYGDQCAI